jgi:antitoxin YefM
MQVISFTKARNNLKKVLDRVSEDADCTIITRRGSAGAVVMSMDHYNGLMETMHVLQNSDLMQQMADSLETHNLKVE